MFMEKGEKKDNGGTKLQDRITQIEDLQKITQMDILNLKNEIDKIKISSPSPLPIETEEKIAELEKIAEDIDTFRKWKKTVDEVKFLREKVASLSGLKTGDIKSMPEKADKIDSAMEEISSLKGEIEKLKEESASGSSLKSRVMGEDRARELSETIENTRKSLLGRIEEMEIKLSHVKDMVHETKKTRGKLRSRITGGGDREKLSRSLEKTKNMLTDRIENLERKMKDVEETDVSGSVKTNREEINELVRKIKSGRSSSAKAGGDVSGRVEDLEGEMESMKEEIKKLREMEKRKPEVLPVHQRGVEDHINNVKSGIESILRRLDKDESAMKSMFRKSKASEEEIAERVESDVEEDIHSKISGIKVDVLRAENQIQSVISDMREIKKGVERAEREGLLKKKAEISDVKKKLTLIEKRLEELNLAEPRIIE